MAQIYIRHRFAGGWASDFGPSSDALPDKNGFIDVPFLVEAENIVYELDGGPHKMPGTTRLNSAALESGAVIKGLFDFWITGTGGAPSQKRLVHVGTTIKKDDADGTFTDIVTGLTSGAIASYAVLEDLVVMVNGVDANKQWDGTTAGNLTATPGVLGWVVTHKNYMWGGGSPANPSRLFYSRNLNASDWTGAGSGEIDIDPDDGDGLTGAVSHKGDLFVFKGPNVGSIHRITGSAPTGSDAFARVPFAREIGAVWHNTLFRFRDDIGFMTPDGTVHSLSTTANYGDFTEAALSRPIQSWLREHLTFNRMKHIWAKSWPAYGIVLFAIPIDSATNNTAIIGFDYRFEPVRWFNWPALGAGSLALVVDPADSNKRIIMAGGNDGFVRKLGRATRTIDTSTAIQMRVKTPHLTYGEPQNVKTIAGTGLSLAPHNNGDITFGWQCDDRSEQTESIGQGGSSNVLGPASANEFTLDDLVYGVLGGARYIDRWRELQTGGEFRSVQYRFSNSVAGEDVEIHAMTGVIEPGGPSMEN